MPKRSRSNTKQGTAKRLAAQDAQCALFMSPINFQSRRATVTHLMRCWLEVIKCLVVIEGKTGEGGPWRPYAFDLDVANGEYSNRHFPRKSVRLCGIFTTPCSASIFTLARPPTIHSRTL